MELAALEDYDWSEAFVYADGFGIKDVEHIEGSDEGENDEQSWIAYGRLKDGRWFYLTAWCDYTGWD